MLMKVLSTETYKGWIFYSYQFYAVFEYLSVKCIEQRAKEATERARKNEAASIGKNEYYEIDHNIKLM